MPHDVPCAQITTSPLTPPINDNSIITPTKLAPLTTLNANITETVMSNYSGTNVIVGAVVTATVILATLAVSLVVMSFLLKRRRRRNISANIGEEVHTSRTTECSTSTSPLEKEQAMEFTHNKESVELALNEDYATTLKSSLVELEKQHVMEFTRNKAYAETSTINIPVEPNACYATTSLSAIKQGQGTTKDTTDYGYECIFPSLHTD